MAMSEQQPSPTEASAQPKSVEVICVLGCCNEPSIAPLNSAQADRAFTFSAEEFSATTVHETTFAPGAEPAAPVGGAASAVLTNGTGCAIPNGGVESAVPAEENVQLDSGSESSAAKKTKKKRKRFRKCPDGIHRPLSTARRIHERRMIQLQKDLRLLHG